MILVASEDICHFNLHVAHALICSGLWWGKRLPELISFCKTSLDSHHLAVQTITSLQQVGEMKGTFLVTVRSR